MDRKTALKIMDKITPLGLNVVLVAIADPTYGAVAGTSEEPNYQIELSRNNALTGDKIQQVIQELGKLNVTVEFPNMTVYTEKEVEARTPVPPPEPEPEPTPPTDGGETPVEPTPEDPVPAPVEASPTTDDVVASGHDDPRDTE